MPRASLLQATPCLVLLAVASTGCRSKPQGSDRSAASGPAKGILADTGFRPGKDGYKFENQGGAYPRTPPVLTSQDVAKMFGGEACIKGADANCKLKPVATEWMGMVNRAMNAGQCEGMAVSSLAFYKKVYNPASFAPHAKSVHDLTHAESSALIGYFWAYQMTDPVRSDKVRSLEAMTPISAEETLVEMMKRNELAVIAIRSKHGGHAVTPYAVEDRGEGIHWIDIYDNNWPDKDRHIVIDHDKNSWSYELASLNPDIPREPWSGDAESHTIAVTPLADRLQKPACPFCESHKKTVVSYGTNGVVLTNGDGKKLGRDGDKIVNEIPGAEVFEVTGYIDGEPAMEPIYTVPADDDYQVAIVGRDKHRKAEGEEQDHGVVVIGNGSAVAVQTAKLKPTEQDTLSLARDGGIKYKTAREGEFPTIRLAANGPNGGMHAHLSHMQASANDEIAIRLDHAAGQIVVAGGGKKASSFDLKVTHVQAEGEDKVVEQKAIKYDPAKVHTIQSSPTPAPGAMPFKIATKLAPPPPPASASAPVPAPSAGPAPSASADAIGESSAPHRGTGRLRPPRRRKSAERDPTSRARERRLSSPRHVVQVGREREVPQENVENDGPGGRLDADHLLGLRDLLRDEDPHPVDAVEGDEDRPPGERLVARHRLELVRHLDGQEERPPAPAQDEEERERREARTDEQREDHAQHDSAHHDGLRQQPREQGVAARGRRPDACRLKRSHPDGTLLTVRSHRGHALRLLAHGLAVALLLPVRHWAVPLLGGCPVGTLLRRPIPALRRLRAIGRLRRLAVAGLLRRAPVSLGTTLRGGIAHGPRRTSRRGPVRTLRRTEGGPERSGVRRDGPAERVDPCLRDGRGERRLVGRRSRRGRLRRPEGHARWRGRLHGYRRGRHGRLMSWRSGRRLRSAKRPANPAARRRDPRRRGAAPYGRRDADHGALESIRHAGRGPDRARGTGCAGRAGRHRRRGGWSSAWSRSRLIHHQHRALELRRGSALQLKVTLGARLGRVGVLRATIRTEHYAPHKVLAHAPPSCTCLFRAGRAGKPRGGSIAARNPRAQGNSPFWRRAWTRPGDALPLPAPRVQARFLASA